MKVVVNLPCGATCTSSSRVVMPYPTDEDIIIPGVLYKLRSIGQIAGYYFHVVVLWVKLQATVLGVCWAIFLSL